MAFTNYLENAILGHVFGSTTMAKPSGIYIGLFTAAPGPTGGGTEISTAGTGYARMSLGTSTLSGNQPAVIQNSANIEWAAATTSWGTITYAAAFDAASGGNMLAFAQLTDPTFTTATPKTINAGDVFRINSGNLQFTQL